MAHARAEAKTAYTRLVRRLNRHPQGAPPSQALYAILKMLFGEREASLAALLPLKPFTAEKAARIWKMNVDDARQVLDGLAGRAVLLDIEGRRRTYYVLPPPMAGFFEFALMRLRGDIDQKLLSKLYHQYVTIEPEFGTALFSGETKPGRAFVHEPAIEPDDALHVLDYERASEVIKTARHRSIGLCYCRHKARHAAHACAAPLDICMTFGSTASSLARHGYARAVDAAEGMDLLRLAYEHNLVQFGENVRQGVNFICNCCGCCCEAMIAARRFAILRPVHTTNFLPEPRATTCTGCGECVSVCPVEAMTLVSANDPRHPRKKTAKLDGDVCLGCAICVRACKTKSLILKSRPGRVITPLNAAHRVVVMAIERGKLQDLIFDNRALASHRAMAAILGNIFRLPPVKRTMASRQMKSRYLEALIARLRI